MSKLLLIYGLFAIGAVSFLSFADAKISVYQGNLTEAEQKVLDDLNQYRLTAEIRVYEGEVTIPLKHPLESKECRYHPDDPRVWTECVFIGPLINGTSGPDCSPNELNLCVGTENGCLEGYVRDIETQECKLPEQIEKEALEKCFNDTSCPVGLWEDEDGNIVNNQGTIGDGTATSQSPEELPESIYKCGYDIGLYQNEEQFEVPIDFWIDEDGQTHVRLYQDDGVKTDNFTTVEELAVEACLGQWDLEVREAIDVRTTVPNSEDFTPHHSDAAFGIPPIGQARVNEEANKDFDNLSFQNLICNGPYSQAYKTQQGCEPEKGYEHDETKVPEMKNVISDEIGNKINQYNEDDGENMSKDLQKENIAEQIRALQKQLAGLP